MRPPIHTFRATSVCSTFGRPPSSPSLPTDRGSCSRCMRPSPTWGRTHRATSTSSTEMPARRGQITSGAWSDRSPVWSPDGSRLAFLSDRITPGHQLPYTMVLGGEPVLAASLHGSAEAVSWSSAGDRLLVLAADPGCYGLDWSARAVRGAEPAPDPSVIRPGEARRRLFEIDLASGDVAEVGPPGMSVWEFDGDPDDVVVALVSEDSEHCGVVPLGRRPARPRRTHRARPSTGRPGRSRGSRSRRTGGARPWSRATRAIRGC